jgi:hypothetical protein
MFELIIVVFIIARFSAATCWMLIASVCMDDSLHICIDSTEVCIYSSSSYGHTDCSLSSSLSSLITGFLSPGTSLLESVRHQTTRASMFRL